MHMSVSCLRPKLTAIFNFVEKQQKQKKLQTGILQPY